MSQQTTLENSTPPLVGRLWLLASLTLVTLPHLLRQPIWLALFCLFVVGWRLLRDLRAGPLPPKWIKLILMVAGLGGVLATYHTIAGKTPGTALLTVMMCMKLLEMRSLRDAMVLMFLGYFLVVTGFLFSQSIFMGTYLFVAVLALTTALLTLNWPQATTRDWQKSIKTSASLLLQALPLMVILFVLFPRIPGPLWGLPEDSRSGKTGLSDEMEFGAITFLADSNEIAFRVQFDDDIPPAGDLYWRGPIMWFTNGYSWNSIDENEPYPGGLKPISYDGLSDPISYTVTMEPNNQKWMFALDLPNTLPDNAIIRPDFQLLAKDTITEVKHYRMSSVTQYRADAFDNFQIAMGLRLPEERNSRTVNMVHQWITSGLDERQIIDKALDYFRSEPFYYTRQPPAITDIDVVDGFLFDTKRGFCEHYAASFVTMMRAANIPARIVTGYQGGTRNPVGEYLIIRQSDAHAWAEVWLQDEGWVRIDPTAVIPPERVEAAPDLSRFNSTEQSGDFDGNFSTLKHLWRTVRNNWDAVNHFWNQWILGFDKEKQKDLMEQLGLGRIVWQQLGMLLAASALLFLFILGGWLLIPRHQRSDPANQLFDKVCHKLARVGIERQPGEGALDFARRVETQRPDLGDTIFEIAMRYSRLRYGKTPDERDMAILKEQVKHFSAKRR